MTPFKRSKHIEAEREFLVRSTQREILGPFSIEELESLVREKKIGPLDEVSASCGVWTPIKYFTQLLKVLGEVPSHSLGDMTKSMTQEFDIKPASLKFLDKEKRAERPKLIRKLAKEKRKASFKAIRISLFIAVPLILIAGLVFFRANKNLVISPSVEAPAEVQLLPLGFKQAYQKGRGFEEAALYKEATEQYEKGLRIVPDNVSARIRLAAIKIQEKKFKEAEGDLAKLNIEEKLSIEQKRDIANYRSIVSAGLGRDEESEKFARQAIQLSEKFAPAYFNLGRSLFRQRNYFDAKSAFEKAVIYQPNQTLPFLYLGLTLGISKHWEEGVEEFQNATQVNPRESLPYLYLAYGFKLLQKEKEANRVLENMTTLDPDYEENHLFDDRYSRDENEYKEILANISNLSSSNTPVANGELALLQFLYGDKLQGISALEQLSRENPDKASLHALLGYVSLRQGKNENAKLQLQETLRYDYSNELAQTLLGDLLLGTGEAEEAISHYNKVLSANAFNLSALQGMAVYYIGRQQYTDAQRIEEQILQIDQNYIPARRGLLKIEELGS